MIRDGFFSPGMKHAYHSISWLIFIPSDNKDMFKNVIALLLHNDRYDFPWRSWSNHVFFYLQVPDPGWLKGLHHSSGPLTTRPGGVSQEGLQLEFFNHNLRLWVQEEQKKFNLAGRGGDEGWVGLSPVARGGGGHVRLLQLPPGVDVPPPFGHWGPGKLQGHVRSFCQRGDQVSRSYHPYLPRGTGWERGQGWVFWNASCVGKKSTSPCTGLSREHNSLSHYVDTWWSSYWVSSERQAVRFIAL